MVTAYAKYREIMQKTFSHHPHIGMCKFGGLRDTQHAIEIFQSVVFNLGEQILLQGKKFVFSRQASARRLS